MSIVPGSFYLYAPNKGAPIFFAIAFGASTAVHLWQCIHYKSFTVTALLPFACLLFTVGFAIREYGAYNYGALWSYITSMVFLYAAPPILELANFHTLGRIFYYVPYASAIHPGRTLTTFGTLCAVVEVLNGLGVAWSLNIGAKPNIVKAGAALLKASLIVQLVVIACFYALLGLFHYRCTVTYKVATRAVVGPIITMYLSTTLILIRCIYRTVENFAFSISSLSSATDANSISPILRHEWFFYVFEASLMLANVVLWNVRHPRRYLPRDHKVYLAKDGKTEVKGSGWITNTPVWVTFVDPFGVTAILWDCMHRRGKGAGQGAQPWEENHDEEKGITRESR